MPADFMLPADDPRLTGSRTPGSRTPGSQAVRSRRSRTTLTRLIAVAAVALFATGIAVALLRPTAHTSASRAGTVSSPSTSPPASPSTSASSASASSKPPASAPASTGALPAGYYRFTNSTGFSIGVPRGWQISHDGHYVYIRDPANSGIFLLIDQSDQPRPDPLADWQQQAASRQSSYPGYHLILLQAVRYPQAEKAADWEFTYDRDGVTVRVLNRNVLANAQHAYALYWSTPASDWDADYHFFQAFADTFTPAPAA